VCRKTIYEIELISQSLPYYDIVVLDRVTSTMDAAKEIIRGSLSQHVLVIANHQTQGRGKRGRKWYSEYGRSLLFTVGLPYKSISMEEDLNCLFYMFSSLGVVSVLQSYTNVPLYIKNPNDIFCNDKKLAGILIELIVRDYFPKNVLIGVGVNISLGCQRVDIDGVHVNVISMSEISSKPINFSVMVIDIVKKLEKYYAALYTNRNALYNSWRKRLIVN